jgi:hypothetical protein
MQETAHEIPVKICETEEDLKIAVAGSCWQLSYGMNCVRLYLNAFKQDNEPNKADQLHLKFPL